MCFVLVGRGSPLRERLATLHLRRGPKWRGQPYIYPVVRSSTAEWRRRSSGSKESKRKNTGAKAQDAASAENAETFYTALASPSTNSYLVDTVPNAFFFFLMPELLVRLLEKEL
jgi:hypothetical protein